MNYSDAPVALSTGAINARDAGVVITVDPQVVAGGLGTLTGTTCSLLVSYLGPPRRTLPPIPMIVSDDGTTASRTSQATDFPLCGECEIQFVVDNGSEAFSSAVYAFEVGKRL